MKQKITAVLSSVVAGASIATIEAGFLPGVPVVADLFAPTSTAFVGSAIWQTSPDGTTWTNTGVAFTGGFSPQTITLSNFVRLNVTAFTSGSVQGRLISDID